jgi:cholesterol oxidase
MILAHGIGSRADLPVPTGPAVDNAVSVRLRRGPLGRFLSARSTSGTPAPTAIPVADDIVRRIAAKIGGRPRTTWGDVLGAPLTAHPIGGCVIGDSAATGVVDPYHRVHGSPGVHVIDASAIPANLGANPALTVAALAERAISLWPNAGEADPRPAPGAPYARVEPVAPRTPVFPVVREAVR